MTDEFMRFMAAWALVHESADEGWKAETLFEDPKHPWFVGCQFHPEFRSRPGRSHPLFHGFIGAAKKYAAGETESEAESA